MKHTLRIVGLVAFALIFSMGTWTCHNAQKPQIILQTASGDVIIEVEIAKTLQERQRGLMGRQSLDANEGMLFIFPSLSLSPFWMENTPLSLDILFINTDLQIDAIFTETVPYSRELIRPEQPYRYVLEIPGGTAQSIGLQPGDSIILPKAAR